MKPRVLVALLAAVVFAGGLLQLTRPGYSVDEEFTVFAVRGIQAHGLPVLPSGLLYDRGIAYSYASWLAGAVTGSELPAFRAVSLVSASLCVLLTFFLVRRLTNDTSAVIASMFVMLSVPFWATATTARFYAPFLGAYLLALYFLTHRHWWIGLFAAAVLARLTHELAFTLAVIPVICFLAAKDDRRHWLFMTAIVIAGLLIGQLAIFGFHYAAPASGSTMITRFFLWQVINLFERPGDRQFAIPLVVIVVGLIFWPRRAWPIVVAISITAMILAFSIAQATNSAPLSVALVSSVLMEGSRYPLDMFWNIASRMPVTLCLALGAIVYRALKTQWPPRHRAAHAMWIGWVLFFGVIESGITINYLLLPITFMLIAIGIDAPALSDELEFDTAIDWREVIGLVILAILLAGDQWRDTSLADARPTIVANGIDQIRNGLQPNDRIVCTDELGCMMLVGRIDRWLALDDYVRQRFLVQRGDGPVTGVYTGVPAALRPADVFAPNADGSLPNRIFIVDIFKDYPIGNSRSWLPRAIEQDGVKVTPLLETTQLRVLEVSAPEAVARLQPSP